MKLCELCYQPAKKNHEECIEAVKEELERMRKEMRLRNNDFKTASQITFN